MDKKYWQEYYSNKNTPQQPSLFAMFVLENLIKENESLIELGCGNGRDSLYFSRHGVNVTAIDQCENEISLLSKNNSQDNPHFRIDDFTKLEIDKIFNHVYSRFTLHSINENQENDVIIWSYNHLQKNGLLLIEARGKKNELYKLGEPVKGERDAYIYEGHYRRFIDINILKNKLLKVGFEIKFAEEKKGFAPFEKTNYNFIRIIALKK
jgi:tellurite methyltransferase